MIGVYLTDKSFGDTTVLGRMSLNVQTGETVAILGASGIGKSTLLRIIAGLDTCYGGQVERPDRLAMVFQEPTLLPWRTARENLTLAHRGLRPAAAEDMLNRVGLAGRGGQFPGQMSLGQQRRLALARAFAGAPQALILDEPFTSLDPDTHAAMLDLTRDLIAAQRPATLLVTHDRAEAQALATRTLVLSGAPATLSEVPCLRLA